MAESGKELKISCQNDKEKQTLDLNEVDEEVFNVQLDEDARLKEERQLEIAEEAKQLELRSTSKGGDSKKKRIVNPIMDLDFLE